MRASVFRTGKRFELKKVDVIFRSPPPPQASRKLSDYNLSHPKKRTTTMTVGEGRPSTSSTAATDDEATLANRPLEPTTQTTTHLSVPPIRRPRAGTNGTIDSAYLPEFFNPQKPPPLDFKFKLKNPLLYLLFLLVCNVLIPCVSRICSIVYARCL